MLIFIAGIDGQIITEKVALDKVNKNNTVDKILCIEFWTLVINIFLFFSFEEAREAAQRIYELQKRNLGKVVNKHISF